MRGWDDLLPEDLEVGSPFRVVVYSPDLGYECEILCEGTRGECQSFIWAKEEEYAPGALILQERAMGDYVIDDYDYSEDF